MTDTFTSSHESQCQGKVRFVSRSLADASAKRRAGRGAYHCNWCGGYHVGHRQVKAGRPKPMPPEIDLTP